jgi:site-specific DNA-methyltransferase (adenine-specific)
VSRIRILHGDSIAAMRTLPDHSVDAIVTDPPYGIRFMGKAWDGSDIERQVRERDAFDSRDGSAGPKGAHRSAAAAAGTYDTSLTASRTFQVWCEQWAREALRVIKPGGWMLAFGSTRMFHRLAAGIEDAGWELRDTVLNLHDGTVHVRDCPWLGAWSFGTGFPKSLNPDPFSVIATRREVSGVGTALKPAFEPIVMARAPMPGTVVDCLLEWGTGALNIDGCRVGSVVETWPASRSYQRLDPGAQSKGTQSAGDSPPGRWPANMVHDGSAAALSVFPDAPGAQSPVKGTEPSSSTSGSYGKFKRAASDRAGEASKDSENTGAVGFKVKPGARREATSAARFFYCAKASRADRNDGLENPGPQFKAGRMPHDAEQVERAGKGNTHPTVKPTELMRYLVRLVTPPGGTVLDPFVGSGSTLKAAELEGFDAIGIEREQSYVAIAEQRVAVGAGLMRDVTVEKVE